MARRRERIPFDIAMDLTPDDLPDGAFFAMAHEIAGLEYGDGFDEIEPPAVSDSVRCACGRTFKTQHAFGQHDNAKHGGRRKFTLRH